MSFSVAEILKCTVRTFNYFSIWNCFLWLAHCCHCFRLHNRCVNWFFADTTSLTWLSISGRVTDPICSPDIHKSGYYGNGAPRNIVMSWCLQQVKKERLSSKQRPVKLIWQHYATTICLLKWSWTWYTGLMTARKKMQLLFLFLLFLLFIWRVRYYSFRKSITMNC